MRQPCLLVAAGSLRAILLNRCSGRIQLLWRTARQLRSCGPEQNESPCAFLHQGLCIEKAPPLLRGPCTAGYVSFRCEFSWRERIWPAALFVLPGIYTLFFDVSSVLLTHH